MRLRLYNTLGKSKQEFVSLEPGKVRMYNCGPTVYSYCHIGNLASFLLGDLLRRYLEYSGHEVLQVMNITDVGHMTDDDLADGQGEDKLEKKAKELKKDPYEIARFYEDQFQVDRKKLNILPAHSYPRATEHIPEMIRLIGELLECGLAYESGGQVYFSIDRYPRYGILSGNTPEELLAGHRVEKDPLKRNALDFTLWKKDPHHLMQWDSPWGRGFPGWHIECSAMSRKYLGEIFDIHTGGEDNIFPHHECEIAQSSEGNDVIFARYWLHRRHILVEKQKMAKSAGNFFTLRDLTEKGYSGLEIRYALISAHYRSNLNFSVAGLTAAREALRYLREFGVNAQSLPDPPSGKGEINRVKELAQRSDEAFRAAMDDDVNISGALAQVHGFVKECYKVVRSRAAGTRAVEQLRAWDGVLGVLEYDEQVGAEAPESEAEGLSDAEIQELVRQRDAARAAQDYKESDRIRDHLKERGVILKDRPERSIWHRELS